ncbi:MAG: tRNA (adenosine(37)-N6)-threonylcarbamoyltransferase complex ATPase subunit type 1 TsaE [Patescibacteria group bacterium]
MTNRTYTTSTTDAMFALAENLLPQLVEAKIVFLKGELGSGKTTFAQGVGKALGISSPLRSPTFTLVNVYEIQGHEKVRRLVHADLYRLESVDRHSWRDLGLEEYAAELGTLVLVEWPERLLFIPEGHTVHFLVRKDVHSVQFN